MQTTSPTVNFVDKATAIALALLLQITDSSLKLDTKSKILKLRLTGHLAFLSYCLVANCLGEAILTTNLPGSRLGRGEKGMQPLVRTSQGSTGDNQQTVFKKMHHIIVHFSSCNFSNYCVGPSRYLWAYWQSET